MIKFGKGEKSTPKSAFGSTIKLLYSLELWLIRVLALLLTERFSGLSLVAWS